MGYMNEFPHSTMFDSDLREILEMFATVKNLPTEMENFKTEMLEKYGTLENFVTAYFENLDVQEEVNNKLEAMYLEGKLAIPFSTPQMFGAVGDGVTDDIEAFQNALNANNYLYIPKGTYFLSKPLLIKSGCNIVGEYQNTIIKVAKSFIYLEEPTRNINIRNLNIYGGEYGLYLSPKETSENGFPNGLIENLYVGECSKCGIYIRNAWDMVLANIHVSENEMGLYLEQANSTTIDSIVAFQNKGCGIHIKNSSAPLFKGTVQENGGVGLYIDTCLAGRYSVYGEQNGYLQTTEKKKSDIFVYDSYGLNVSAYTNGGNSGDSNMKNSYGIYADYMSNSIIVGEFVHHANFGIYITSNSNHNQIISGSTINLTEPT